MTAQPARSFSDSDYDSEYDSFDDWIDPDTPPGGDPSLGDFIGENLGTRSFDFVVDAGFDKRTIAYVHESFRQVKRMRTFLENTGPNQQTADRVRTYLARKPELWRDAGYLSRLAAQFLVTLIPEEAPEERDAALLAMDEMRLGLGWAAAPAHERLLIDQVTLAMFAYQITALIHSTFAFGPHPEIKHADYWDKRLGKAERRLQRATKTLARVRKLTRSTKAVQGDLAAYLEGLDRAARQDAPAESEDRTETPGDEASPAERDGSDRVSGSADPHDDAPSPSRSEHPSRGGHGVTYTPSLRWGPFGGVRSTAQLSEDEEQLTDNPLERLRRVTRFTPRTEMGDALDAYIEYMGMEDLIEPTLGV